MSSVVSRLLFSAAIALVLLSSVAVALFVGERVPDGIYCGNYGNGLVVGNLTMKSGSDKFDMVMVGLGLDLQCKNETFIYDPKTHHAKVPGATDPKDCIGAVLTDNDLTLDVVYKPDVDEIVLDLGFTKIDCKKCSPKDLGALFCTPY
ncbi:hypothetical protein ABB37_07885 [Leptomonas pyrrhocoris]|uniref:Uncharacterized protein n=1 Tax=Leptomonas pyrrhocoris TaxID=157538 RepID=A0A0M9FU75_LEPPY|nr:hypothetical protein ABB37_07885 [Leptomonas pyrrhocoris]KPA76113.1 hypothetical protein ABB37_07885 [Leptomonas pyrrhocoris]|eukprot:XP_015654552.1 hypothetical protein ABB37_07885 [Leptomonas pyrrhocoris]